VYLSSLYIYLRDGEVGSLQCAFGKAKASETDPVEPRSEGHLGEPASLTAVDENQQSHFVLDKR
jgi:hypothetical protein